jgi:hypothetical protein
MVWGNLDLPRETNAGYVSTFGVLANFQHN